MEKLPFYDQCLQPGMLSGYNDFFETLRNEMTIMGGAKIGSEKIEIVF